MQTSSRQHICLVVALAVLRVATAGQQAHHGFNQALRIQAATSKDSESPTKVEDPPAKSKKQAKKSTDNQVSDWTNAIPNQKAVFKMPDYHHADSLSAATDGFLDWFVVCYWGTILLVIVAVEFSMPFWTGTTPRKQSSKEGDQEGDEEGEQERGRGMHKTVSILAGDHPSAGDMLGSPRDKMLAPNIFSLSLVAARGEAKDGKGNILSPVLVFVASVAMGLLQLLTLFLVVYDIDPAASPYTAKPGAPWKTSPLTVNCMKVVMTFFLGMYVVSEAADAYDNFILGVAIRKGKLLIHWSFVVFIPIYHYFITLTVILAGVSVVLSCQDVPNILYNSMAILFITRVDELFWGFFERTFDIEAEWKAQINDSDVAEVQLVKKCIIMFPMLWGFCLLGRAWYRDQMPALVVRVLAGSAKP